MADAPADLEIRLLRCHAGRARAGRAVRRDPSRHTAQAGLAVGGRPADDAALDTAFAATPYMLDAF